MEEKLVSNELGMLAKAVGFNEPHLKNYHNIKDDKIYGQCVGFSPELYDINNPDHIGLPTLNSLRDYLRLQFNIHIKLSYDEGGWNFSLHDIENDGSRIDDGSLPYEEHDMTLESALYYALGTKKVWDIVEI